MNEQIKNLYEHLDLSSLPKIQKAYQRLEYLLEQIEKGSGFYDCYSCQKGVATQEACAEVQRKFTHFLYLGDRDTYDKYKDPKQFAKIIEESVAEAETTPPPMCRLPMPNCDFSKDPQCKLQLPVPVPAH